MLNLKPVICYIAELEQTAVIISFGENILLLKLKVKKIWQSKHSKMIIVISSLLIFFMSYFIIHRSSKIPPSLPIKLVETEILAPTTIQKTIKLIGTVRPKHTTVLAAKGSGLLDIFLSSGQTVKKGDLIAKIINPDIEKSYQLSKATAKIASTQYKRLQSLQKTGFVSTREVEEKKQSWIEAQKELAKTKIELKNMRFYAPFDGIIGAFKIKEGAQVNEASAVVTVYDPSNLTVEVDIPCTNMPQIKANQSVYVFNKPYRLNHLQKMIDDETHMCPADVDIHCKQCLIGANITVDLVVKEKQETLVIPTQALFLKNGKPCIYKVNNNHIELVGVKTGIQQKNKVEITSGLKPGDQVIIKSPERLYPGLEVAIYHPPKDKV